MIVLPEAAGPQDAVISTTARRAGSVRRTTNIDSLRPDGLQGDVVVDARARDLRTGRDGTCEVVGAASLQARISPTRELLSLTTTPDVPALQVLLGASVGPGFRSRVNEAVTEGCEDGSLLYLLLDDLPGATLVSGYALHRGGALEEGSRTGPPRTPPPAAPASRPAAGPGPFPDFGRARRHLRRMGPRRHHDGPRPRHGNTPGATGPTRSDSRAGGRSDVVARHGGAGSACRAPPPAPRPHRATRRRVGASNRSPLPRQPCGRPRVRVDHARVHDVRHGRPARPAGSGPSRPGPTCSPGWSARARWPVRNGWTAWSSPSCGPGSARSSWAGAPAHTSTTACAPWPT